jgi:acetyl/propionyl-CoA carboxylase alpha subunit/acetyl-CoA carboxylase carboxyltransferase component
VEETLGSSTASIGRVAVVNRGEAARRLIRAATELQLGGHRITTIAFCTDAERNARFVREADEHEIIASSGGIAYLDYAELERALIACRADAVWVGWGFVAEHAEFADLCDRLGLRFIGPSGDVMRLLGDKIGAKRLAESVGAPVAPWSGGPVRSADEALRSAEVVGFPLLVKATAGGGGRGIRFVDGADELADAYERASAEALSSFGDATVFLERRLTDARHIEVQIAADDHGTVWALGVRDCSMQRRNQKVIEESSSVALSTDQERFIAGTAVELARAAGYRNVGTVEFLYQPASGDFAFLEVNTRLQVEHPVTELTTGVDLVKLQLHLAVGGRLEGEPPEAYGHAIEARLNAEDPQRAFSPAPGRIDHLDFATGPGIRIDAGVAAGDVIPSDYDAMIAKVIAWGRTREEARVRLLRSLEQTAVVVAGGTTNKAFLADLLGRSAFVDGAIDTAWLDRLTEDGAHLDATHLDKALIVAALDGWERESALDRATFYLWSTRGRPQSTTQLRRVVELRAQAESYKVTVSRTAPQEYRVELDGDAIDVELERYGPLESRLSVGGEHHRVFSFIDGVEHHVEIDGVAHRLSRDSAGLVRAPAPALVVSVAVGVGSVVAVGDPLVVLESMKMETTLSAPVSGTVSDVHIGPNTQVDAGTALVRLEGDEESADGPTRPSTRVGLGPLTPRETSTGGAARCLAALEAMRWLILGFEAGDAERLIAEYRTNREPGSSEPDLVQAELAVLHTFADVAVLGRNRPNVETGTEELHSPELYFHKYLRSLDSEGEGLPESFRARLAHALGHFGLATLDRTDDLEEAAHQLFEAHLQIDTRRPIVMAVLSELAAEPVPDELANDLRSTLDQFVDATQVRHASVGDQARTVRFRLFDEPGFERARVEVMASMRGHLDDIGADRGDHQHLLEQLVGCPYPLVGLLRDHEPGTSFDVYRPLLEVLTTRNYQVREIVDTAWSDEAGRPAFVARYRHPDEREPLHTIATLADAIALPEALHAVAHRAEEVSGDGRIVADLYVSLDDKITDAAALARCGGEAIAQVTLPSALDRVTFSAAEEGGQPAAVTFRRASIDDATPWVEDTPMRGIHPLIAVRLGLTRFRQNFHLEPLAAPRGTNLFRATGSNDRGDERLFAAAEVRELAATHDQRGRLVGIPGIEQAYTACIEGLRRAQVGLSNGRRLLWNRVFLYVWQPVEFDLAEAAAIIAKLEPLGQGLGVEEVGIQAKLRQEDGTFGEHLVRIAPRPGRGAAMELTDVPSTPLQPLGDYERKVVTCRQRGSIYPYELVAAIAGSGGTFDEHDVGSDGGFVPVERKPGLNVAGIVAGVVTTPTDRYPEGMRRVVLIGDPTKSLGSLAEAECRIIMAALDHADQAGLPVEWFSLSSGARIAMDSGTENMDWIAAVLRRIVAFTQGGGEINVVVTGINVGAQPYWNAEATMLQHTSGILVMTPDSAMVLTGKQALDISGGVSAEDNFGIGGYDRVMGPNGQAQYWAPDIAGACRVLFAHYDHAYRAPGERFPRPGATADPSDRDIRDFPHSLDGSDFTVVGDIFSNVTNPGRKKPFDIRSLMRSVVDQDSPPLERWAAMEAARTAVVYEAKLGGLSTMVLGIESHPLQRHGALPADGPDQWTAGTLFPRSSNKVARAINAASGKRPVVILANLSGFDGSPESLRMLQLEYGAEIGRAMVNFDGPLVFCVVSRYHGGAFVVFSGALNDNIQVLAVEGTYASVLGGAPAAAAVFAGEVRRRAASDPRVASLEASVQAADPEDRPILQAELAAATDAVTAEKLGDVADEFDAIHSIERARDVGSVDRIISAAELRPELIAAVKRGMAQTSSMPVDR